VRAAGLLLGSALLLLPELGSAPFERAEIYFMDGARSLVERGDALVPYYRGEPFFDKPALTYWLMAASYRAFGFSPKSARLVSAAAALGVLLSTLALGVLVLDRRSALVGALLLATTLAFLSFGRVAMSDMLLTLWTTLALASAFRLFQPAPPSWTLPALGAVLGLGFLTKGPIALLLPGLGILFLRVRASGARPEWTRLGATLAVLLFVACGLGWFVALYLRLGWDPLAYFFLRENLQRFAAQTYDAGREWWFYVPAYLAVGMPWSLFLPVALSCHLREDLAGVPELSGSRLLAAWAGLMLLPLSLSRGKIDYYLLPALPAVSLVLGHYFVRVPWRRFERVWARVALVLAGAALVAVAAGPLRLPQEWLPGPAARWTLTLVAAAGAAACGLSALRVRPLGVVAPLASATALVWLVLCIGFLPAFRDAQPNAAIVGDVSRELRYKPEAAVVVCADPTRVQRDLLFFARLAVTERCDLWNPASSQFPFLMLLSRDEFASLDSAMARIRLVREYPYLPAQVLSLRGLLNPSPPEPLFLAANYHSQDPVAREQRRLERQAERDERARQIHLRMKAERR
jgi:4-amino-4-deoxy-L-arabinose transferase-like glycosyltransferase